MYGIPQAGILANKPLKKCLNATGYYQCQHTLGLWHQVWHDIIFCLFEDNFGVKTTSHNHIMHLKTALEKYYTVGMDWNSSFYCGVNID